MTAPAVIAVDTPSTVEMPTRPTPMVPVVVHELPTDIATARMTNGTMASSNDGARTAAALSMSSAAKSRSQTLG
jgi:hypothetical protein